MNDQINRRQFLKRTSALSLCGFAADALTSSRLMAADAASAGDGLVLSLNAYSFAKPLNDEIAKPGTGVTLMKLLDFVAQWKFPAIDPTGYYFLGYPKRPDDAYIDAFKKKAADLGIAISGTGVRNTFTTSDQSARDADVKLVKVWIEVAARMGAPVIRVFADTQTKGLTWQTAAKGFTHDQVQAWMVDDLKQCADYGKQFGVRIGVQNHGDFIRTGEDLLALIKAVDSPWCGPIVDTGQFRSKDPYADIALVAPHAFNWQIKQSMVTESGNIPMDLDKLFGIVRKSGYRGYFPIETIAPSGQSYDPFKTVPAFLQQVRDAMARTV